jgi:hypothetical protein
MKSCFFTGYLPKSYGKIHLQNKATWGKEDREEGEKEEEEKEEKIEGGGREEEEKKEDRAKR